MGALVLALLAKSFGSFKLMIESCIAELGDVTNNFEVSVSRDITGLNSQIHNLPKSLCPSGTAILNVSFH
jgi:hypothetical protein